MLLSRYQLKNLRLNFEVEVFVSLQKRRFVVIVFGLQADEVVVLTPEQRNELMASKKEIEQGLYVEQEILDKEVLKWLSAK